MRLYRKIVTLVTIFFAGVSGVFLVAGAGAPGLRLLVGLIFFISLLNLSLYTREFGRWLKRVIQTAGGHLAAGDQPPPPPPGGAKSGGGKPGKPGGKPAGKPADDDPADDDDDDMAEDE